MALVTIVFGHSATMPGSSGSLCGQTGHDDAMIVLCDAVKSSPTVRLAPYLVSVFKARGRVKATQ